MTGGIALADTPRIAVVGSANTDLITFADAFPRPGETLFGTNFDLGFGGKGANQAVAAAKLGAEVVMVTNIGDDTLGDSALKNFESYGIDTRHVRRIPNQSTGTATILVDEKSGDNSILIVAGANGDLSSADVDAASGAIKRTGELPTNTHGGLLSEAYIHGFNHVIEAVEQLRGESGVRQIPDARVALTTAGAMTCGSALILGS